MSSNERVKQLRARRAEQGLVHFRMRTTPSQWEQMEVMRYAILEARGETGSQRSPGKVFEMWVTPAEREMLESMRACVRKS